jgi:hypothetical protein
VGGVAISSALGAPVRRAVLAARSVALREVAGVLLVSLGVLAGAVLAGFFVNSARFSDADGFAAAGRVLLSSQWRHTYADPWLQAGPFEQLICLAGRTLGITPQGEPPALNTIGALALLLVAIRVLGRDWKALLYVGVGATGLGIISDLYEIGHPSELFIALAWMLAARATQRDAVVTAGLLLGLSAGFETWGLLGAPILLLLPTTRRAATASVVALATAAAIYLPFALGGDFQMFKLHWYVAGGFDSHLLGQHHPFTWPMRMIESVVVVGFGSTLAILLRKRTGAALWIVPAATSLLRLMLDPVRYPYYWDTGLILMLLGTAPWISAPCQVARELHERLRLRFGTPIPVD